MNSFTDDNKIKDENMFSENITDEFADADNPEEASAVSRMVRNIAEGESGADRRKKKNSYEVDEEAWDVPEDSFLKKLLTKPAKEKSVTVGKEKKVKPARTKKPSKTEEKTSYVNSRYDLNEVEDDETDEIISFIDSITDNERKNSTLTPKQEQAEDDDIRLADIFLPSEEEKKDEPVEPVIRTEVFENDVEQVNVSEEIVNDTEEAQAIAEQVTVAETPAPEMPEEKTFEEKAETTETKVDNDTDEKDFLDVFSVFLDKFDDDTVVKKQEDSPLDGFLNYDGTADNNSKTVANRNTTPVEKIDEEAEQQIKEMRWAVEDVMYSGETSQEREERHKRAEEIAALPVIDLSEIDFFSNDKPGDVSDAEVDEIGEHLAMVLNDEFGVKKKKKWPWVVSSVAGVLVVFALFILFTRPGHALASKAIARFIFSNIETIDEDEQVKNKGEFIDPNGEFMPVYTPTPTPAPTSEPGEVTETPTPVPTEEIKYHPTYAEDPSVINILLIGVENYEGYAYGRSDSMMIASMDKDGGDLKLVSLMRDMYVEIPGYADNRLNAAYALGGAKLLMETIELNFGLKCDGYVYVDYSGFEAIVDYLGGIEISLTEEEAQYLNTTNYISDKKQRHVVEGSQIMTGNQVVGYCRIRHVKAANGLQNDFGRTYRQRVVMDKIFEKYKSQPLTELYKIMSECFKYVKCPAGLESLAAECMQTVVEQKMFTLKTYRIPVSGYYDQTDIIRGYNDDGSPIKWNVLLWEYDNADILHDLLYGEQEHQ